MPQTTDHFRIVFQAGPTILSEAFYDNYEECLDDLLGFVKMYWGGSQQLAKNMSLEELAESTGYGEGNALGLGNGAINIWWHRVEQGHPAITLN